MDWLPETVDSPGPGLSNLPVLDDVHPSAPVGTGPVEQQDATGDEGPTDAAMTETDAERGKKDVRTRQ